MDASPRQFEHAREFHRIFPSATDKIIDSKRDHGDHSGWVDVKEWISRAPLYERYLVTLAVAVAIGNDGTLSAMESPKLSIVEVTKVELGKEEPGGPKYQLMWYQFENGAWEEILASNGDFSVVDFEFVADAPVDRFEVYWRDVQ